jgi:rhamnosyltransferase
VLAVVVCYQPNIAAVVDLGRDLRASELADVLFVDNTESVDTCPRLRSAATEFGIEVVCQGVNLGIGEAHNVALRRGLDGGYRAVLLLDQDTQVEPDTLARLLGALDSLHAQGTHVAAVGATYTDPRNEATSPFFRLARLRMHAVPVDGDAPVECDLLISSGSLISLDAVRAIGGMDRSLFIDYVDMEWCTRARSAGWHVYGVPTARTRHTIGEETVRLFGRMIPIHTPQRQYYIIRNALLFARKAYLPFNWRVHLVYRAVTQLVMFSLLRKPRLARARWLLRGFVDGVLGRSGRLGGPHGLGARAARPAAVTDAEADTPLAQSQLVK